MRKEFRKENKDTPIGIKLPLSELSNNLLDESNKISNKINSDRINSGIFSVSYSTKEQIHYNIKNLILTQKGERRLNLNFGIDWKKYFFGQKSKISNQSLKEEIIDQCNFWLPFIDVMVQLNEYEYELNLEIRYKFKNEQEFDITNSILLNINNEGEIKNE
jgi:phage baseplate assembly protein W